MKLENILQLRYRGIYIVISFVILFLVLNNYWYFVLVPIYMYYLFKNHREIMKLIVIFMIVFVARVYLFEQNTIIQSAQYTLKVTKDIKVGDYTSFIGSTQNQLVKVYMDESLNVRPGDSLLCYGEIEEPINNTTPNLFNYRKYLKSQNIKYILYTSGCEITEENFNINIIPYILGEYIDNNFVYSNEYIKTFILADKSDFDDALLSQINTIGISHLFAVSGLHISLIVLSFMSILKKFNLKERQIEIIITLFLIFYMMITAFSPSVTRASLMFILLILNKRLKINLSSIDILSVIFLMLIFIKPYYYYDVGFLLSFLVTYTILLSTNILKVDTKLKQLVILSTVSFLVTVPIILNLNYQVNLLTLFFNLVFLSYITYIILPLGYITFALPFFDRIYFFFIEIFEMFLNLSSHLDFLIFRLSFPNFLYVLIYYITLFITIYLFEMKRDVKKAIGFLIVILFLAWSSPYYNLFQKVTFLDVHGDSAIIIDRFDKCNIIIDTGEVDNYNTLVNYLKTNNVKRIDYLIITHYHSDHYGETNDLINNFDIVNLVNRDNAYNFDGIIKCGNIKMFIYQNQAVYNNENDMSIILSLFISNKHYLFTGDIELEREVDFINNYDIDVDYLKVPHHGSITSSSVEFINDIRPEEVFISVSRRNRHNHPSEMVVDRYIQLGISVYRTDLDGTIIIRYIFGKEYKKVHSP